MKDFIWLLHCSQVLFEMTRGNPWGKPILKTHIRIHSSTQQSLTDTQISSPALCFVQQFSERKTLCFIFSKMWMSFWSLWISRWQPITVILSVSMSSTVLTQLPEDGELAWFNHLLTHSTMITHTHTARRRLDGCGIVTALIMIPKPPPIPHFPLSETNCKHHPQKL